MKNASEVIQFSHDSDGKLSFLDNKFFGSLLKKKRFCLIFKSEPKKIAPKKLKLTILLLVIRRFLNYTKFHYSSIDRKCRKL